jgi:hypothetical protein
MTPAAQRNIAATLRRRAAVLCSEAENLRDLATDFENSAALLDRASAETEPVLKCIHGVRAYARCIDCENDQTGFRPAQNR